MSTMQAFAAPAPTVNCHWTPVSLSFEVLVAGLPPCGASVPMNGIMTVVTAEVTVTDFWGAYEPYGPPAFLSVGFATASACPLSLVEYCMLHIVPATEPLMSNLM